MLLNSIVKIEKSRKSRQPPQCKRFHLYGYTRDWCHRQPRCVKCIENYSTDDCIKSRDTRTKCVLCFEINPNNNLLLPILQLSSPISTILSNIISNLNAIISSLISLLTKFLNSLLTKVA